jgi:pimeloyl-ACP methyl ester carboxylesterase
LRLLQLQKKVESRGEVVLSAEKDTCCLWPEYYLQFPCFSELTVRAECYPRKLLHAKQTGKSIVLIHGLTDSPFYMLAIAKYFHENLGYNVYLPLLHSHGLKNPEGMAGVSLVHWKQNVRFAIQTAAESADRVSIGGFSTGGALSYYFGCTDPQVTGDVYLFSAAFGIYGGGMPEFLLRIPFIRFLINKQPLQTLVGIHPYRYDQVPLKSAGELARLISENDKLLKSPGNIIHVKRIFAAWSEHDRVIDVNKLSYISKLPTAGQFVSFVIPKAERVSHACVVLKEQVYAINSRQGDFVLEEANPRFAEMMSALSKFESAS